MSMKWIWCGDFATVSGARAWAALAPSSRTWGVVLGRATGLSVGEEINPAPPIDTQAGFTGAIHDEVSVADFYTEEEAVYSTVRAPQTIALYRAPMVPDRARIFSMLSAQQRTSPLDTLFVPSKGGVISSFGLSDVEVISESAQGLRRRQYVLAYDDVGASAFGEPAVRPGAVPGAIVEYRYRLTPAGLVEGEGRVRYPLADGSGDLDPIASLPVARWRYQGLGALRAEAERVEAADLRARYLESVGAKGGIERDPVVTDKDGWTPWSA